MKYTFICDKCKKEIVKRIPMEEVSSTKVFCDCGTQMHQKWSSALQIPDYMKAGEEQEIEWVKDRLQNRPSGKRKVLY